MSIKKKSKKIVKFIKISYKTTKKKTENDFLRNKSFALFYDIT